MHICANSQEMYVSQQHSQHTQSIQPSRQGQTGAKSKRTQGAEWNNQRHLLAKWTRRHRHWGNTKTWTGLTTLGKTSKTCWSTREKIGPDRDRS